MFRTDDRPDMKGIERTLREEGCVTVAQEPMIAPT